MAAGPDGPCPEHLMITTPEECEACVYPDGPWDKFGMTYEGATFDSNSPKGCYWAQSSGQAQGRQWDIKFNKGDFLTGVGGSFPNSDASLCKDDTTEQDASGQDASSTGSGASIKIGSGSIKLGSGSIKFGNEL